MTDDQPRQLLPETESHQNLSSNLGVSRPLPPRSRSKQGSSTAAKPSLQRSGSSEAADVKAQDGDALESSHDSQATGRSNEDRGDLEARGTASPVRMSAQRVVSSSSIRSTRSGSAVPDIPKEEIEKALEGLDRDDLVVALGRAKVQMDEIEARLEEQVLENETLHDSAASLAQQLGEAEVQVHSLQSQIKQREERIDEMMAEQDRMEGEVYSTMQVIERLRKQLGETERGRNDAEKRYLDQTATMDKERQYYMDTEALLKSQKATQAAAYEKLLSGHNELLREHERLTNKLASMKAGGSTTETDSSLPTECDLTAGDQGNTEDSSVDTGRNDSQDDLASSHDSSSLAYDRRSTSKTTSFAQEQDMAAVIEELTTLQKSHSSMSETMATLQAELKDVRAENVTLRDQNETFMDILQEKTFSGALLNESAMLRGIRRASLGRLRAQNGLDDPYDEEYSTEADSIEISEDDDETRTGNTSLSSGTIPEEDEDVDDVPDTPRALPKETKSSRRRRTSSSAAHGATNLASELEGTKSDLASPENKVREKRSTQRVGTVSDSVDELQKEVLELREANQALTLYISKIIDRIIAKEGYENILAIESRGSVRGLRNKASRARLSVNTKQPRTSAEDKAGSRNVSNSSQTSDASASSGLGGGLFKFGSGSTQTASDNRPSKSKRTGSIDWRNLPFIGGGSSNNSSGPPSSKMRPLTLQSGNLLIPPREGSARKVRTSEEIEDDNDVAERERIRQELLMRGIEPPKHQLVQSPVSPRKQRPQSVSVAPGAGGFAAFFSRVVGGATSNTALSPGKSDAQSQASTTPGQSVDAGFERQLSSTPAVDSGKRDEERNRALQLSEGSGSSLTKASGGQGIASKARQLQAERNQQTLDLAADSAGYPFPTSSQGSTGNSRATSGANSFTDSSILENSVAGDESYCLPAPPLGAGQLRGDGVDMDSPLIGYGASLPPLPTETTGNEDPDAFRSPTLTQNKTMGQTSQDQGWKRALRRISLLSTTSAGSQPVAQDANESGMVVSPASEVQPSPLGTPSPLPATGEEADK